MQRARARRPTYRSALARCLTGRCVCQLSHELVRREIAEARMRTHLVVVPPPCFDEHFRLGTRMKPFEAQALIAEFAVEAFRDAILPRLARLDQCRSDALRDDPRQQSLGYELRAVVAAQEHRRPTDTDQPRQHLDHARRADAAVVLDRQSLLCELVRDRQALELLAVGTVIEHKVIGPNLVRTAWCLRSGASGRRQAPSRSLARHLQARKLPQPMRSAGAHAMTVAPEKDADAPIAAERILLRPLLHPLNNGCVLRHLAAAVAQPRSCHAEQRAGPSHREATLSAIRNLTSTSRHAHQFFAATSFMTSISRSRSATSFFSRAFSASSCFRRRTSLDCKLPNRLRQV